MLLLLLIAIDLLGLLRLRGKPLLDDIQQLCLGVLIKTRVHLLDNAVQFRNAIRALVYNLEELCLLQCVAGHGGHEIVNVGGGLSASSGVREVVFHLMGSVS